LLFINTLQQNPFFIARKTTVFHCHLSEMTSSSQLDDRIISVR
jgi:hypothetical protein